MGRTVKTWLRDEAGRVTGTALLETSEIIFRGERRRVIPLAGCKASVSGGDLVLAIAGETVVLELGAAEAEKWRAAIANPRSVVQKLGVKPGQRVSLVGDGESLAAELRAAGIDVGAGKPAADSDAIFFAVAARKDLVRLPAIVRALADDGALWILRPRGGKDPGEAEVRAAAHAAGLVDVKVVRVSDETTGDKFVVPVAARGKKPGAPAAARGKKPGDAPARRR